MNLSPDCVALTNKRFIVYKPKLLGGAKFIDYIWRDLKDAKLTEKMLRATITMYTTKGTMITIDDLPKVQARKLYSFAQEMEENMLEERRNREMEEKRAGAGGIVMQTPGVAPVAIKPVAEDLMKTLSKLKKCSMQN